MIQLRPTEKFVITRQLSSPRDTNTYFVRAFVRNALDDTLLDTIDLDDKTDQRFRGTWEVVADGSGEGFYITITTKVYTDSGFTTESNRYARLENEYLVQERFNHNVHMAFGGGSDIDYKKIAKIVKEEIAGKELVVNLESVITALQETQRMINDITIPETDLKSLTEFIKLISENSKSDILKELKDDSGIKSKDIKELIKAIKMPVTDLSGLSSALERLQELTSSLNGQSLESIKQMIDSNTEIFNEKITKTVNEELNRSIKGNSIITIMSGQGENKEPKRRFRL